jgi:uncharacterized protein YycO
VESLTGLDAPGIAGSPAIAGLRFGTNHELAVCVMSRLASLIAVTTLSLALAGCWEGSLYGDRPKDKVLDDAIDRMWTDELRKFARDGDWILSRSLSSTGDMIGWVSKGENFSHASMIDVTNGSIIEAITPVVREIPIEVLVHRNWYLVVVRPSHMTAEEQKAALERARAQIGKDFDVWGFIGYPEEDKWYCSELAYWASGFEERSGKQVVIFPNELLEYGEVIYYTGRRDDAQVLATASGHVNSGHDAEVAGVSTGSGEATVQPSP